MLLNSAEYLLFVTVILVFYYVLPGIRWRNAFLLIASYSFCAFWDWRFVIPLVLTTVVDFWAGRMLADTTVPGRRWALWAGILVNIGLLTYFRYWNFFIDSMAGLLAALGLPSAPLTLNVLLPVGLSFYTLQSIAYKLDVYRGIQEPERDFLNLALFTAYFPQLVAGPIERAAHMLPQFKARPPITVDQFESGVVLILLGMFKKVVIADVAGRLIDGMVFSDPAAAPSGKVLIGVYLFALQLYADFAGYTDIIRGVSRLLGIDLVANFKQPYFAPNIAEFWSRWHISLSTWLRDYIFFPTSRALLRRFGTAAARPIMVAVNLLTMLVSGLWHGASWPFVVWGLVHGIYLSVHRLLRDQRILPVRWNSPLVARLWFVGSVIVTFHLFAFSLVFFRSPSVSIAFQVFGRILSDISVSDIPFLIGRPIALYGAMFLLDTLVIYFGDDTPVQRLPVIVRGLAYVVLLYSISVFWAGASAPFIYFQF